jgi:hypothetical protein
MPKFTQQPKLTRTQFRTELAGHRLDVAAAQKALAVELAGAASLPTLQKAVRDAGRAKLDDGFVTAQEAGALFDRLKAFDSHSTDPGVLTVSKPTLPKLAMSRVLRALETAAVVDPSPGDGPAKAIVASLPGTLRAKATAAVPLILAETAARNLSVDQTAYVLATARLESLMGNAMQEIASGAAYEGRLDLGNTKAGDGVRYKGRGFVQITGRKNYKDWSSRLGIDLVGQPALAQDPKYAVKILVGGMIDGTFTGYQLADFINASKTDFVGARRIINGLDRAQEIAGFAEDYRDMLA